MDCKPDIVGGWGDSARFEGIERVPGPITAAERRLLPFVVFTRRVTLVDSLLLGSCG